MNSSSVRFLFNSFLPLCTENASCIRNPNHIWPIMSMLSVATHFDLVCIGGGMVLLGIEDVDVEV